MANATAIQSGGTSYNIKDVQSRLSIGEILDKTIGGKNLANKATDMKLGYYWQGFHDSNDYYVFSVPIKANVTYRAINKYRFISVVNTSGQQLDISINDPNENATITSSVDATCYLSIPIAKLHYCRFCVNTYTNDEVERFDNYILSDGLHYDAVYTAEQIADKLTGFFPVINGRASVQNRSSTFSGWGTDFPAQGNPITFSKIRFRVYTRDNAITLAHIEIGLGTKATHTMLTEKTYSISVAADTVTYIDVNLNTVIRIPSGQPYYIAISVNALSGFGFIANPACNSFYNTNGDLTRMYSDYMSGVTEKAIEVYLYGEKAFPAKKTSVNGNKKTADSLTSGQILDITSVLAVRKSGVYTLSFEATNYAETRICHGTSGNYYAYLKMTPTAWSVVDNGTETIIHEFDSELKPEYFIVRITQKGHYKADINIQYPGDGLNFTDIDWHGCGYHENYIMCVSGTMTNVYASYGMADAGKPIAIIGDSYTDSNGWIGKYNDLGYDNLFENGFGGADSTEMVNVFDYMVKENFCRPKMCVFALGMNDGSDGSSAPHYLWLPQAQRFVELCNMYNITPVFQTVPTVPSINNEQKNAWIRASGYRYVDVAKAVGAQADGTWYTNMLSQDGVHPTYRGDFAILYEYIRSLPELIQNP